MKTNTRSLFACVLILLLASLACTIDFGGSSDAQETLTAIYLQDTLDAQSIAEAAPAQEEAAPQPTATIQVTHSVTPGTPGWVSQWWMDTDSSSTASQNRANGGDYLNQNLLERSFTAQEMTYRPDVDLGRVEISQDNTFYYFVLHLDGVYTPERHVIGFLWRGIGSSIRTGAATCCLWARGDGSTTWNIEDVFVYSDENNDVGGIRAYAGRRAQQRAGRLRKGAVLTREPGRPGRRLETRGPIRQQRDAISDQEYR